MIERKYTAAGARLRAGFTAVPNLVLRDTELSGTARLLYAIMLDLAWQEAEPELDELGKMLGGGRKLAMGAVKELVAAGLLESKRRGLGKTNAYVLHEPREDGQKFPQGTSASSPGPAPSFKDLEQDREVEADASTSRPGEVSTRKRNVVFDALVAATHATPSSDGGIIGKAAKAIREAMDDDLRELTHAFMAQYPEADEVPADVIDKRVAAEIDKRATLYAVLRPEWELTPSALAKHWNRIPTWKPRTGSGRLTPAQIARGER